MIVIEVTHYLIFTVGNQVAKVTFLQVSVCPQGGVPGQVPPRQVHPAGQVQPSKQVPPRQVHPQTGTAPWPGTLAPATVHAGIQSTSGQYASHWNAFLLHLSVCLRRGAAQYMLGYHPPRSRPPVGTDTPPGNRHPPRNRHPPANGYCCGQYAYYWNVFLF